MNEQQNAIKASSKVIAVIMKIFYIFMIVAMCVCASSLIFLAATGGETSIVTSGGIKIAVTDEPITSTAGLVALLVSALILSAFLFTIFLITYRMFNEICLTGTPFKAKYVKVIKILGVLVAAMTIVGNLADYVASNCAGLKTVGMDTGITGVLVGVVIFCLAYIFDFGCTLQKQSDETL